MSAVSKPCKVLSRKPRSPLFRAGGHIYFYRGLITISWSLKIKLPFAFNQTPARNA